MFEQMVKRPPEALESRFQVSHSIMVQLLQREPGLAGAHGGYGDLAALIERSHTKPERKRRLRREAARLFRALRGAGLVHVADHRVVLDPELQRDFSLHQALSLFLVEAISALDANDPSYALQVITCVEAVIEDPVVLLRAQARLIRAELSAKLKAERVPFEERVEKLDAVTHPKPDARFLYATFRIFADQHPWVSEETIRPKSIAREMLEGFESFNSYVRRYGIQRNEGTLLRYLGQVLSNLDKTVPDVRKTDEIHDLLATLRDLVRRTDTSLLEEWESRVAGPAETTPRAEAPRVRDVARSPRAFQARVRTELHALLRALAERDFEEASLYVCQDPADPWDADRFEAALRPYFERHPHLRVDAAARRPHHTVLKELGPRLWSVQHALLDPEAEDTWCIEGRIDLREPVDPEAPLVRVLTIHD